jgi:aromatic ring-opening dioxygenase catalytic subunit (LigB family)
MAIFTRRQTVIGGLAGAAALAAAGREGGGAGGAASSRLPVVYLPHGGGPWPFVELPIGEKSELDALAAYLRELAAIAPGKVRAVLAVSAHWEERVPTVMTAARPPMLYDYYGFPPAAYEVQWPAPGDPQLASRVRALLSAAGIESAEDPARGFDHGTFVPLKLTYPAADVPTVQLSLRQGLDPAEHLAIGRALAPLRDEGVLIVGSGMSFHNLRAFMDPRSRPVAATFDAWLQETTLLPAAERDRRLGAWASAPAARAAHPREEHLLPLMVVAGAAGSDPGRIGYSGTLAGLRISAHHFGVG